MANFDNICAGLEIEDLYTSSTDTLGDLVNLQADTQKNVYGYNFQDMTLAEIRDFWHMNEHAMLDEMCEAFNALGGIKDGIKSGIWKRWKKDYNKAPNMKLSDLTESDMKELKMELIDMLHFMFNYMISIGMTADEIYNYYMSKNKENRDRQKRGY